MSKPKTVFLLIAALFLSLLFYASYDFAKKTTFPGKKRPDIPAQDQKIIKKDSLSNDSLENVKKY